MLYYTILYYDMAMIVMMEAMDRRASSTREHIYIYIYRERERDIERERER